MINLAAEFWSGPNGDLFRIKRNPDNPVACVVFVPPLFEEMNRHRHVITRAAIKAYQLNVSSVVYDAIGTGDSQGHLSEVTLAMWQQELLTQLQQIKLQPTTFYPATVSPKNCPIILSVPCSAALLLTPEIIKCVDGLQLWQPELSGKKFVKQLKRLSLAQNLNAAKSEANSTPKTHNIANNTIDISGYCIKTKLLAEISTREIEDLFFDSSDDEQSALKITLIEFVDEPGQALALARENQSKKLQQYHQTTEMIIAEHRYWQASELINPEKLLSAFAKSLQKVIHAR